MSTVLARRALSLVLLLALALLPACSLPGFKPKANYQQDPNAVPGIVLALPATGNYATIAQKIQTGANVAAKELNASGQKVSLRFLSTDGPWLQQLSQLPTSYAVVGGPLQEKAFSQAVAQGLTARRAFFTFMPTMKSGSEGVTARRFFYSAKDQADAVVRCFATLGVTRPAAVYPTDAFGTRMTELVEKGLAAKGLTLQKVSYAPNDQAGMSAAVKSLVASRGQASCDAIFLPDSWRNMATVASVLEKSGEHSMIEMGTMMWDGYLNGRPLASAAKYPLCVFPSPFVREMAPAALPAGSDTWTALGYDFVKFARRLSMTGNLPAEQVNSRARKAALMNFAMAPISYDGQGHASQRLFLLQPGLQGAVLLNRSALISTREAMRSRAADDPGLTERASEGSSYEYPYAVPPGGSSSGQAQAATLPSTPAPAASSSAPAPAGPSSVKPGHTSYKLSVPGAPR